MEKKEITNRKLFWLFTSVVAPQRCASLHSFAPECQSESEKMSWKKHWAMHVFIDPAAGGAQVFPVTFSPVKVNLNFSPFRFATSRCKLGFVAQPIMQLGIATMKGSGNLIKTSDNCFQRSELTKPFWSIVSAELVIQSLMNKVTN